MEELKQLVVKHFEKALVAIILIATFAGTYFVEEKSIVLNFFYLPILSAGYFLGRRMGILTAILSILVVVVSALLSPLAFFKGTESFNVLAQLFSWGGFLILASVVVGTLYEQNERRLTEVKRMEGEKRTLEEQFRQTQKLEAIGKLAGGIAHDFNNLLTVIRGYGEICLEDLPEGHPLMGSIQEMKKASESGARLVRQLLAFSRRQIMEMRVVDLNTILQDLGKMLDPIIGDNIQLRTVMAEHLGGVKTDVSQIEQVIMNLVINARDAMSSGGKLTVETANIDLDENYCQNQADVKPGHYVMISVSDTGCGIPPHIRDRIFEPFFTTKAVGQGTGLGLSTVYGIVKQCGGHIEVNSNPGWGTTFKVYLPRIDEPAESHAALPVSPELLKGSETVFVIEDNAGVRKFIRDALQRYGYEILEASNGENAIGMMGDHSDKMIHLLLTDVVIPGMSGRECAECLTSFHPEMKVLYMSGHTEGAIVHQGVLGPGAAFLQKPFTPNLLAQEVRHVLDNSIGMVGKNQNEARWETIGKSIPSQTAN